MNRLGDKLFHDLVQNIITGEEDLEIAKQNGRPLDQWMMDRIDDVHRSYEMLLCVWPLNAKDSQEEPECK